MSADADAEDRTLGRGLRDALERLASLGTSMELPSRSPGYYDPRGSGLCKWCDDPAHEHDKTRIYTENGRWHYRYHCVREDRVEETAERLQEKAEAADAEEASE